jgi:putative glutamine amidotransferase
MSAARSATPPVIAVTGFLQDIGERWGGPFPALAVESAYFRPFHENGAVTVLVPSDMASVATLVSWIDGVLLTGGADVHPARYRSWSGPYQYHADPDRDDFELELIRAALARGIPVLGVCRGIQVLNVALGGTLQMHVTGHLLLKESSEPIQHVRVIPGSRLHAIMESGSLHVNSMHHQAIEEPGQGLRIVAWADDGTPEAVEHSEAPVLGIQWHPEKLADPHNYDALVGWLLDAASRRRHLLRPRPYGDRHAASSHSRQADR